MTGLPILDITGLSKSYGAIRAVDGVDLQVHRGEICGLIGPNGSGKSTFFDCASGLARPNSGSVPARAPGSTACASVRANSSGCRGSGMSKPSRRAISRAASRN